jgi:UDP-N-acetylglucosamine 2-epimerase (non-hydrolysing)
MKIISVVGARPNFMKVAPIIAAIEKHNLRAVQELSGPPEHHGAQCIQHLLVHTGQHYDQLMSDVFFADLALPQPDIHLGVGSGSHAVQTAEVMKGFEKILLREKPDAVLVVGDVNSTLACALVAAKLAQEAGTGTPRVGHVEAGLRSFDRSMPEEYNRVLTDHLSDLLFVTEPSGLRNLKREGIPANRIHFVGNTMIDSLVAFQARAEVSTILERLRLRHPASGKGGTARKPCYALLTLHRPANVDKQDAFSTILEGLEDLARQYPVIFPAHPRTQKRIREFGLQDWFSLPGTPGPFSPTPGASPNGIRLIDPLGYLDFLYLMKHAALVVTDSGGVQEETTCLGVPCVTVRENTERPVTLTAGTNRLAGVRKRGLQEAIRHQLSRKHRNGRPEKWDGRSGARIVAVLAREFQKKRARQEMSLCMT